MTEPELRALVRSVIAQTDVRWQADTRPDQAATAPDAWRTGAGPDAWRPAAAGPVPPDPAVIPLPSVRAHASHALFVLPAPGDACVIEPAVACNHCGYCKSYGH